MKGSIFALILALGAGVAFAQNGPIDLILLLDTSSSMITSRDEVNNYISGAFLKEFLRIGDTVHLLPFSDRGKLDFVRRIESRGDVEALIGRMFLHSPIDPWSDIPGALSFAEQYTAALPSRPKKIVLLSDGVTTLPPARSGEVPDAAALAALINDCKTRLGRSEITLDYVRVVPGKPLANLPRSGRTLAGRPASPTPQAVPASPPPPVTPALPPQTANPPEPSSQVQIPPSPVTAALPPQTANPLEPPSQVQIPPPVEPVQNGELSAAQAPLPQREPPPAVETEVQPPPPLPVAAPALPPLPVETRTGLLLLKFVINIMALFLLGTGLFAGLTAGLLWKNSIFVSALAVSRGSAGDTVFLNLFVEDQNTFIGRRNTHTLKSGCSLTLGGGNSDFLIFLAPVREAIGEVRRDGGSYTFILRKPRFFPDLGPKELPDCVGKTIRALSDTEQEVRFTLERYGKPSL